jgi:hypothetical protein
VEAPGQIITLNKYKVEFEMKKSPKMPWEALEGMGI